MPKFRALIAAAASLALAFGGVVAISAPAAAAQQSTGGEIAKVCGDLDSGKIDVSGSNETLVITAPAGMLIDRYCVKSGSAQNGSGPEYVTIDPPKASVTISHSSGKDISHYAVSYVPNTGAPTQEVNCTTFKVDYDEPLNHQHHVNLEVTTSEGTFQIHVDVDGNIAGGWNGLGLLVTPGGKKIPLTEEDVKSGVITWNYAELLGTDTFTVMFVQTNETDTWPKLECAPDDEEPEPTVVVPTLTYTDPTCFAAGSVTASDDVDWTQAPGVDGGTVWTASTTGDDVFADGATIEWPVPNLDQLAASHEECRPAQPEPQVTSTEKLAYDCADSTVTITTTTVTTVFEWNGEEWVLGEPAEEQATVTRDMTADEKMDCPLPDTTIEYAAWVDGEWDCGDTTVEQTREVSTTVYEYAADGTPTATSSVATETQTRELTQAEIAECPLLPGDITSVCVGDVPYLGYDVTLPEGYVPTGENPVTITFVNPEGDDYVVTGQPLTGSLLWPGASAADPMMWPGWELVDGEYAPTDGNFAWTREGVTVRFAVNPTYETTVMYPEATALCANPPIGGPDGEPEVPGTDEPAGTDEPTGTSASTDPEALAVTGGGAVSPIVVTAGAAAIAAGIALLVVMAYRRRRADIG